MECRFSSSVTRTRNGGLFGQSFVSVELAMKVSDFTICESKVREAAATGTLVDLRVGDRTIDSPEKGTEWGIE
jgi:hypothetical protein